MLWTILHDAVLMAVTILLTLVIITAMEHP